MEMVKEVVGGNFRCASVIRCVRLKYEFWQRKCSVVLRRQLSLITLVPCVHTGHETNRSLFQTAGLSPLCVPSFTSLSCFLLCSLSLCHAVCTSPPLPLVPPVRAHFELQDKTPLHSSLSRISCRTSSLV